MAEPIATPIKHKLLNKNFGVASFKFNRWSASLDESQSLDDALAAHFWAEQSTALMGHDANAPKGRGDIIEIRKLDTGLYAELMVDEIGKGFIKVHVIRTDAPAEVVIPETVPFTTRWNVGKLCHEVVRKMDKQVMASNFQTKARAAEWIAKHMQAMAA